MLGTVLTVNDYLCRLESELRRVDRVAVDRLGDLIYRAWENDRCVFIFGNGGSACTASHLSEDLGKNCLCEADLRDDSKRRLKVMSLTDNVGWITAIGNDLGYDQIFVQQLMPFAAPDDLAIAISGSGNSPNVLAAVEWANRHGLITYGLTGYGGGKLGQIQQMGLNVPLDDMGMVESIHMCISHWLIDDLHARVNRLGRYAS
jgi:D-sedoheptulose 7-phosphate isomerase